MRRIWLAKIENNAIMRMMNGGESSKTQSSIEGSDIMIRTMESDIKAIAEGGGQLNGFRPYINYETPRPGPQTEEIKNDDIIFADPAKLGQAGEEYKTRSNTVMSLVIIVSIALAAGLVGYFFVFPWLFNE